MGIWTYSGATVLPFGISHALLSTLMAALISLSFLYVLLLARRSSLPGMLLALLPALLLLSLLVRGLLGAPLWVSQRLSEPAWIVIIGTLSTLGLIIWAVHIVARGLSRIEWEFA
jgi:ABC-type polysaccharide/polyol phosphate export permease